VRGWAIGHAKQGKIKTNGCQLTFHPGAEAEGKFGGTFDIGPSGCGPISYQPAGCTLTIGSQNGLAATFANSGEGSSATVDIEIQISNPNYTQTGAGCGKTGTFENGYFKGVWHVTGFSPSGELIGIQVGPIGLCLAGEKSEEKAKQPQFEAEKYPVPLTGVQDAASKHVLQTNSGPLKWGSVAYAGTLASTASEVKVTPTYAECKQQGIAATVKANSCYYVLHISNAGPPYVGTYDVACSKVGDVIEIKTAACTTTVGSQTGLGGVAYTNAGTGSGRYVKVSYTTTGIKYTESGIGCSKTGTFETGTYSGGTSLYGL
jgi:hypothetical protein